MTLSNFPNGISSFGVPVFGGVAGVAMTGNYWFVDPANGGDGNSGASPDAPLATLYKALAKCIDGNNDVVVLIGNGQSSGSARLSTALAQTVDSTATAGTLNWNKNATHLIGIAAPTAIGQRARIAPPTGTYTQATFGSGNFIVVSGQGCVFQNIDVFNGFSTGGTNQIAWTDSGGRNAYVNVNIQGIADAASAADTGSRSLKISGTNGENTFINCVIGTDTVTRSVANASVELSGGVPRNIFKDCIFPVYTSSADSLIFIVAAASAIDRFTKLQQCTIENAIKSGSTQMTGAVKMAASAGGYIEVGPLCEMVGVSSWGYDATTKAQMYVSGSAVNSGAGIAVNPA